MENHFSIINLINLYSYLKYQNFLLKFYLDLIFLIYNFYKIHLHIIYIINLISKIYSYLLIIFHFRKNSNFYGNSYHIFSNKDLRFDLIILIFLLIINV